MSDDDILVAPEGTVPMPLFGAEVGDFWYLRGDLRFENGAEPWAHLKREDARVRIAIVEVGPGFVEEIATVMSSDWVTEMGHTGFITFHYMPPGRGWERVPSQGDRTHWRRRRTWVAE